MRNTLDHGAMREMLDWLDERPELPLPLLGAWSMPGERGEGEGECYHAFARSRAEFDQLARHVDGVMMVSEWRGIGARRTFGDIGYEVLLDEAQFDPFEDWKVARRPDPIRRQRLKGLREMLTWLSDRPELHQRASYGAQLLAGLDASGADDQIRFSAWAADEADQRRLLEQFDRVDGLPDQPVYLKRKMRMFQGGVRFVVHPDPEL